MRVVQTRNKGLVFGILLSALVVGVLMTVGQVAVGGEPTGDDSRGSDQRGDSDGCGEPGVGDGAGDCGAAEWANHYDSDASQHLGEDRDGQDGHERQRDRGVGELGRSNVEQHHHWAAGFPGSSGGAISGTNLWGAAVPMYGAIRGHGEHLALERGVATGHGRGRGGDVGRRSTVSVHRVGLLL